MNWYALQFQAIRWVRECDWDQGMDQAEFQDWLSAAGRLTSA